MGTYIVGAIVVAMLALVSYKVYSDRKRGKGCGGGCEGCTACPGKKDDPS